MKKFLATAAAVGLISVASFANASTITIKKTHSSAYGTSALFEKVKVQYPEMPGPGTDTYRGTAGLFDMTGPEGQFFAFCVDLHDTLKSTAQYTLDNNLFLAPVVDNMQKLFNTAFKDVDTSVEAAGFQLALWEIITDTNTTGGASTYAIDGGDFKVVGTRTPAQVKAQAAAYLAGLGGPETGSFQMTFYKSGHSQDLVTVNAVPLPAAGLMLLAGLAGFAGLRRRKG